MASLLEGDAWNSEKDPENAVPSSAKICLLLPSPFSLLSSSKYLRDILKSVFQEFPSQTLP